MVELSVAVQEKWGRIISGEERVESWRPKFPRPAKVKKVYEQKFFGTGVNLTKEQAKQNLIAAKGK